MFNGSLDKLVDHFSRQFDYENGTLIYRKNQKAAGVPVTEAERNAFISEYRRSAKRTMWTMGAALIVTMAGFVIVAVAADIDLDDPWISPAIYAVIAGIAIFFIVRLYGLSGAPERSLHRLPIVAARTKTEMKQRGMQQITYAQLATAGVFGFLVFWQHWDTQDAEYYTWLILGAALVVGALVQAGRKFIHDRTNPTP